VDITQRKYRDGRRDTVPCGRKISTGR
jgi:hypothetical protein